MIASADCDNGEKALRLKKKFGEKNLWQKSEPIWNQRRIVVDE